MNEYIIEATLILTKPDRSVEFRPALVEMSPKDLRSYIDKNYIQTGKMLSRSEVLSEDNLSLTITTYWKSDQDRVEYTNNFIIKNIFELHKKHWIDHNIRCEWINKELDGEIIISTNQGFFNNPQ